MDANNTYTAGSFGHGGAYGTNSWADPKSGLIHIFMIQRTDGPAQSRQFPHAPGL